MDELKVSICASANRVNFWKRFLDSLKGNTIKYEVIFVGNVSPNFDLTLYPEFKWVQASVKPAQCYQIAFWEAKGELIHWTADDADYSYNQPNNIDIAYTAYKEAEKKYNDNKTIVAMRPIEDGGDVQEKWHYFFGGCPWSPRMAPFGLINREYFINTIGGYDRNYISGQSENGVVMDVLADSGRVEFCKNSFLYVHHREVHPRNPYTGKEENRFRAWYPEDRRYLEDCWIIQGYGNYEKYGVHNLQGNVGISKTRLRPFEPFFKTDNVCSVTQGQRGAW